MGKRKAFRACYNDEDKTMITEPCKNARHWECKDWDCKCNCHSSYSDRKEVSVIGA